MTNTKVGSILRIIKFHIKMFILLENDGQIHLISIRSLVLLKVRHILHFIAHYWNIHIYPDH
jgi:hypothetical protein